MPVKDASRDRSDRDIVTIFRVFRVHSRPNFGFDLRPSAEICGNSVVG